MISKSNTISKLASRLNALSILVVCYGVFIISIILCTSCSKPTENQNSSLKGSVLLINDTNDPANNPLDFSGVSVALYNLAVLDTAIVRINQSHPNIGVHISQETEFDHRYQNPIAQTSTAPDGSFQFSDIPAGSYNIAFVKQGWSLVYKYEVKIEPAKESVIEPIEILLAETINGFVSSAFTFLSDKTYVINGDTSFLGQVSIQTGSQVMIDSGVSVIFYDTFVSNDVGGSSKFWKVCSSYNLYTIGSIEIPSQQYINSLSFRGANLSISNGLFRHFTNGVTVTSLESDISNIDIMHFDSGLLLNDSNCHIDQASIRLGSNRGIHVTSIADSVSISNSVIYKNFDGVILYTGGGFSVSNSYFYANSNALRPENCTGVIKNNNFDLNNVDILQYVSDCTITSNNFYNSIGLTIRPRSYSLINYNNFYKTGQYFVNIRRPDGSHTYAQSNVNAKYNYWKVANIDDYILDASDNVDYPGHECPYYVITTNRLGSPNQSAGIIR